MDLSLAISCPSARYQLAGMKKIQQVCLSITYFEGGGGGGGGLGILFVVRTLAHVVDLWGVDLYEIMVFIIVWLKIVSI